VSPPFPKRKYKLIYADPPWRYNNSKVEKSQTGASEYYSTMSIDEIKELPVQDISDDDCVLFMWAVTPMLPDCLDVLKSWGFDYKTSLYWEKTGEAGMGYWFYGVIEQLLLGVKKKSVPFGLTDKNFYRSINEGHSKKPAYFYYLLEKTNIFPKIELFAREHREGWDVWGLEAPEEITSFPNRKNRIETWLK
jgi:N6-adenosine-specific RNA methylase IME4